MISMLKYHLKFSVFSDFKSSNHVPIVKQDNIFLNIFRQQ